MLYLKNFKYVPDLYGKNISDSFYKTHQSLLSS